MAATIVQVQFDDEGNIQLQWFDADTHDKDGGEYITSHITRLIQEENAEVSYWAKELRQDVSELLHHWRKTRR